MANRCASLYRGLVMRATRLNACGQPVYGDCNQVTTSGFISVSQSTQTEDSDAITSTRADGSTCINVPGKTSFSYYELEIEFCDVNPLLAQIIDPSVEIMYDADGDVVGIATGDNEGLSTDEGFALELWLGTQSGSVDACSGGTAQGQWGYLLYPRVTGASEGDLTIENDVFSLTLTGRTLAPNGWRKGPYNIWANSDGIPRPLPDAMPTRKHRLLIPVTTVRPPEPDCECGPVERPIPDPADLYITGVANEATRRTVRFRAENHGFGPLMVDWGDGSVPQEVADGAWVTHTYTADGEYPIKACDKQTPVICASRDVTIPLPADEPTLTLSADNREQPYEVTALVGMPPQSDGTATVDWGDGSEPEEITVGQDGTVSVIHLYSVPSVYTVTVRRGDINTYRARAAILVPTQADDVPPEATAAADPADATGRTVVLTINNTGSSSGPAPEAEAAADPSDATGRTVQLTVNNA
jgi:hypothetical protein